MKGSVLFTLLLLSASAASARPYLVLEEKATITPPDASWEFFGSFGVAIDGDYALVSAERYVEGPNGPTYPIKQGAVFIYQRSGTAWNYAGRLGPIAPIELPRVGAVAMKDGIAITLTERWRIWKRTGSTFALEPVAGIAPTALTGPDVEIDGGRILAARHNCQYDAVVLRKFGTTWMPEGELVGQPKNCNPYLFPTRLDIQGDRAAVYNYGGAYPNWRHVRQYRLNSNGIGWSQYGEIGAGEQSELLELAMSGPFTLLTGDRRAGTLTTYENPPPNDGAVNTAVTYRFTPLDSYHSWDIESGEGLERVGPRIFAQRNVSFDRHSYVVNIFRIDEDYPYHPTHLATLQARDDSPLGSWIDVSGNRMIVSGRSRGGGTNTVRIFELPPTYQSPPPVQAHDFENPGDAALWQPSAGSTFGIVKVGNTNVYRQASTVGLATSTLPTSLTSAQGIQAEITLRAVAAGQPDAWIGLFTRRVDDNDYYFVALRAGSVELRRNAEGMITTLASASAGTVVGGKYRLRLESLGSLHQVYLDDSLVLSVHDGLPDFGTTGLLTHRAAADFDNVIFTPSGFTTIYADDFGEHRAENWHHVQGVWQALNTGVFNQSSANGYARTFTGIAADDQIVRARIRPLSFVNETNWVGLFARYANEQNHLYVSLHERDVIALWRRSNGVLTQLATARLPVSVGSWYDVRLEVISNRTRVFVNDRLVLSSTADPGPIFYDTARPKSGHVGLVTHYATADFDDFLAYQP